ncbi:shikimate kinase [Methanoregula sp.]|uniref:shikimate kinase n=1 Tax=Methanoregula sp. TaxID=2052170 RepID=UPI002374087E|nr:shikimate kinase [Methanoregula sp.]MDD1686018.1 shikimate kinase [Methanoregula sp.]
MNNIILIGLPGAGKSTMGVILAKTLGMKYTDTDIVIQETTGRLLQEIIDTDGTDTFLEIEERTILALDCHNTIIATGGSAVFSRKAMEHLKSGGCIIYLKISFDEMIERLSNIRTRGIVLHNGESLSEMYNERIPLYERYADIAIDCSGNHFEAAVENVLEAVSRPGHSCVTGFPAGNQD